MDRLDSLLVMAPVIWLLLYCVHPGRPRLTAGRSGGPAPAAWWDALPPAAQPITQLRRCAAS